MYVIIIYYLLYIQCFPQDNIKGGGVHQWYPMFSQQYTKQWFSVLTLKLKGGGTRIKRGVAPWYHPLGETLIYVCVYVCTCLYVICMHVRMYNCIYVYLCSCVMYDILLIIYTVFPTG